MTCRTSIAQGRRSELRVSAAAAAAAPARRRPAAGTRCRGAIGCRCSKMARPLLARAPRAAIARRPVPAEPRRSPCPVARAAGQSARLRSGSGSRWRSRRSISRRTKRGDAVRPRPGGAVRARAVGFRARAAARPLHQVYAEPARDLHRRAWRRGATGRARARRVGASATPGSTCAASASPTAPVIAAVPWFALRRALRPGCSPSRSTPLVANATAMASKPIVTVNLWYDPPSWTSRSSACPGATMQWVFDKRLCAFGATPPGTASHLSLVSSGADAIAGKSRRRADRRSRPRRSTGRCPARGAHGSPTRR